MPLLELSDRGLHCVEGDFYIDPWRPVERAVITHAHSDHARWGMKGYLCSAEGEGVLRLRVGQHAAIQTVEYGKRMLIGAVGVTLYPAGHILGSAQVRVDYQGEVWVVSGDYKTQPDATCSAFEPIRCHTFITESTFGLPIYRWPPEQEVFDQINAWWRRNQQEGRSSLMFAYSLGKAQRVLSGLDPSIGPILQHGALKNLTDAYRAQGIRLPETAQVADAEKGFDWSKALILAPPSANGTPWMRKFGDLGTGFASGWMAVRGARRRRAVDRGFVLSDHVDWPSLLEAVAATRAENVLVTHGYSSVVARYLSEQGLNSGTLATQYEGEQDEHESDEPEEPRA